MAKGYSFDALAAFMENLDAVKANKTINLTAGDGLSGGGTLSANRTFSVNSTVVRTSGNQTIGGTKTFSSTIVGSINGNAATATNATTAANCSRTITTGDGLTGGGTLTANRTFAVDSTVVRTSGNQTISGTKTFSSTISGSITGNAGSATKWQTARTLSLSGDASGSVSMNGTANVTLSVTVANDSHTHDGRYFTESESNSRFAYKAGSGGQDFYTRRLLATGTGNDYNNGALELKGNGTTNTVFPTIGFHQPNKYAGSLQMRAGGDFRFYTQGGSSYGVVRAATFYGALSGNASTATWADTVDVGSGNTASTWYDVVWHSGDSVYSSPGVEIQGSTNSIKSNRHYFAGTTYYLREATGAYGTVATYGRKGGWGGYSIEGRVNFMHNGATTTGIFNDVGKEWLFKAEHNGSAEMFYDGASKIATSSTGATVTGTLVATGNVNDSSGRVYSPGNKPSKSDVGLSNVANYGVTSSVSSTSTSHYATAKAVKTAYDRASSALSAPNKVYTGTDTGEAVYPIGHLLVAYVGNGSINREHKNSHQTLYNLASSSDRALWGSSLYNSHQGSAVVGTWAYRGMVGIVANVWTALFERVL
ncbi:intramolecular chaperone auto-processing domain protein [Vibrio phage vB_VpaM_VPs20]|uniref:Intramolecular chaperone auto-processing domain protein n=1 Tax=Vibrio phage vB_VpaM_VPs20 TaxID=2978980 RepID=A0A9X9NZV9_9CAUD|nr:intramolecular chaperone auto-processing domain protein [Vibrio phage vB_VpaM_VPs20]UYD72135.1 intramolecular chaperone auto-processing domain protein [Vibrio phage vB_VpaM_VPs20]